MAFKLLLAVALVAVIAAEEYYPQPTYGRPSYGGGNGGYDQAPYGGGHGGGGYGGYGGGYDYYGPDNAKYYYTISQYDPYAYKHANLYFDRYPGGASYQLKENGPGSYVDVNVETFRGGYNQKY